MISNLQEIAGAVNYWVAPDGKAYRVANHLDFACERSGLKLPGKEDLAYWHVQDTVYTWMFKHKWMRAAMDHATSMLVIENNVTSRQKAWAVVLASENHLLVMQNDGVEIIDFRATYEGAVKAAALSAGSVLEDLTSVKKLILSLVSLESFLEQRGFSVAPSWMRERYWKVYLFKYFVHVLQFKGMVLKGIRVGVRKSFNEDTSVDMIFNAVSEKETPYMLSLDVKNRFHLEYAHSMLKDEVTNVKKVLDGIEEWTQTYKPKETVEWITVKDELFWAAQMVDTSMKIIPHYA